MAKKSTENKSILADAFDKRSYEITITERLLGGAPLNEEDYARFCIPDGLDDAAGDDELATLPNEKITGFHREDGKYFFYNYAFKGFMKESANIIKSVLSIKNLRSKLDNMLFVSPRKIFLPRPPDGIMRRPLRAQTAMGPRVTIASSEYYDPPLSFDVTIEIMANTEFGWEEVENVLAFGEKKGFYQWRNGGFGLFTYKRKDVR